VPDGLRRPRRHLRRGGAAALNANAPQHRPTEPAQPHPANTAIQPRPRLATQGVPVMTSRPNQTFLEAAKSACTGDPRATFVLLGNFEVEAAWAGDEIGLPSVGGGSSAAVVNRMDEF